MRFTREIIGFALIVLAWFDPFGLDIMIKILMFILGFDLMSLIPKIIIFVLDYLFFILNYSFGFGWLGWSLLILVAAEALLMLIPFGKKINIIIKTVAVFGVSFLAFGIQPALIVAGIDLLLNLGVGK